MYTTHAFQSINNPLRAGDIGKTNPHKLPVTVALLADAVKRLRVVEGNRASGDKEVDLYRGMKGVRMPEEFAATVIPTSQSKACHPASRSLQQHALPCFSKP